MKVTALPAKVAAGFLTIGLAAVVAGAALASISATPRLAIVAKNPLTLRATGFHPDERVTVQASAKSTTGRMVVTATSTGGFVARLRTVHATGCTAITAHATGNRGSTAALKIVPECAQPATP